MAFASGSGFGQAANNQSNLFANAKPFGMTAQPSTGGLFGQPAQQQQPQQSGGLFGQPAQQPTTSLFGQPPAQQTQQQPSSGLFGQPAAAGTTAQPAGGGLFGQPAATQPSTGGLFGQPAATQPSTGGLFGQPAATQPSTGGLFGQPAATQPSTGGLFGQPAATQPSGGLFGQSTTQPSTTAGGLFGQATTQPAATTGGGLFGQQAAQPSTTGGLFGQSTATQPTSGGLFGQSTSTQPAAGGLFGQSTAQPTSGGLFGSTTTQPTGVGLFGSTSQAQPALGGGLFSSTQPQQSQVISGTLLSKSTKFNDLPDDMKRTLEGIESFIQGRVQISKDLHQRKLGEEPLKAQELLQGIRKDLMNISAQTRDDCHLSNDMKSKVDQAAQDTIVAIRLVDAFKAPQGTGTSYLNSHANFPLERLSASAGQSQTPQAISATLQAQHATFISLASKTAALDTEFQKIKTFITQLWRAKTGSVRDPFNELDRTSDSSEFGMHSLGVK
ncbi:hypothetical protein H0H92_003182 [Tricholoma furcatifolium]|nr:hypothetical protein H0H92_003182 [Tricholoma furcatifolium]